MVNSKVRLQVRYGDLDTLGHVNNAVYLTYFELGRIDYLRRALGSLDISDISFVIVHAEVDFKKPIHLHDTIFVETTVDGVGNSSIKFNHRIVGEDGELFAAGKTVAVWVDANRQPVPVPDNVRRMILQTGESVYGNQASDGGMNTSIT
ncbi:MAG: thioesterase family protein [Thermoplasmataceae archaeon]